MKVNPRKNDDDAIDVWDINWESLQLFLLVDSQWRTVVVAGLGGGAMIQLGLDYAGVDVVMRRRHIADEDGRLFSDLQVMERAALLAFAEVDK